MRADIAYYLIILYMLAMCKPVLPFVQNELAHIFWKTEHLASVHQHHGDDHAEEEFASAAQEDENNKNSSAAKTSEPVSIHLFVQNLYAISQLFIQKAKYGNRISAPSTVTLDKYYPPPRSC